MIDPNPTRPPAGITNFFKGMKSFLKSEKTGSLEKVVDYFTSTTNPSVVNANNGGSGGIYLYVNDGSLTGTWTRHQIGYGYCYEQAAAFKYPGDKYPGIIASCDNRLVWFENPANSGGDPFSIWPTSVIYGNSGCHEFTLADVDGDGKLDVVCSSAVSLGDMQNFILYQNDRNSWSYVAGVSIGSGTLPNGQDYVVIASNEGAWSDGLSFITQKSDPTQPWNATTIDSSYRAVHHLSVGTFDGSPYVLAAEQEQACIAGINDAYHADIPCRVEIFKYKSGTFEPLVLLTTQGTHNQSVIPYHGGLLIVGANHGIYGGYPALQGWIVSPSGTVAKSSGQH